MLPELRNHKNCISTLTGTVYIISVSALHIKLIRTRSHDSSYIHVAVNLRATHNAVAVVHAATWREPRQLFRASTREHA